LTRGKKITKATRCVTETGDMPGFLSGLCEKLTDSFAVKLFYREERKEENRLRAQRLRAFGKSDGNLTQNLKIRISHLLYKRQAKHLFIFKFAYSFIKKNQ
jgi:hypothetical protein